MSRDDDILTVEFRDEYRGKADVPPFPIRARAFLKRALRSFGLRCIRITGLPPEEADNRDLDWGESSPGENDP